MAQKDLRARMRPSPGKSVVGGKTVTGLGDDGFLVVAGMMPMLYVRKGEAAFSVMGQAPEALLVGIARRCLERLRP